jgi:hypothetical protein
LPHNYFESHTTTIELVCSIDLLCWFLDVAETYFIWACNSISKGRNKNRFTFLFFCFCKLLTLEFLQQRQATSFIR